MKIGFIGLGNIGATVSRNIQRAGFELVVYDIKKEVGLELVKHGAILANS